MDIKSVVSKIESQCYFADSPYGRYPTKGGDGGDDCLWLGLLSSVEYPGAFEMLLQCQAVTGEPRPGLWFRNPNRRFNGDASFSRDMAMGVLIGLGNPTYSPDVKWPHADAWARWIDESRPCLVKKPKWAGGGCLIRSEVYKYSPDDRSDITPSGWGLIGRVWDANGWPKNSHMSSGFGMDGDYDVEEAKYCPFGYVLHLHALEGYLKRIINQSAEYCQKILDICYKRQPDNLLFKILAQNAALDEDLISYLIIASDWKGPQYNWLWSTDKIGDAYLSGDACGWDLVFLGRLIMKLRGEL